MRPDLTILVYSKQKAENGGFAIVRVNDQYIPYTNEYNSEYTLDDNKPADGVVVYNSKQRPHLVMARAVRPDRPVPYYGPSELTRSEVDNFNRRAMYKFEINWDALGLEAPEIGKKDKPASLNKPCSHCNKR